MRVKAFALRAKGDRGEIWVKEQVRKPGSFTFGFRVFVVLEMEDLSNLL